MPGPLSSPKFWTKNEKKNKTGNHCRGADGSRSSGKTNYDHLTGNKWSKHVSNKELNRQFNMGRTRMHTTREGTVLEK